ncbi:MAG: uroporphyrinogen-III synthase [Vicinamibacterales bacterium]
MRWRVCITRAEAPDGRLTRALDVNGFEVVPCPVLVEQPADPRRLTAKALALDRYSWLVASSVRAVNVLAVSRGTPLPKGLRTAAVGARTAEALAATGADPCPVIGEESGAEGLWAVLAKESWPGQRVLVLTTPGGRRLLAEALTASGAQVEELEAYRMATRSPDDIAADWAKAAPDALVLSSPRAARGLESAVGIDALRAVGAIVAMGPTTARTLASMGVPFRIATEARFEAVAQTLAAMRDGRASV